MEATASEQRPAPPLSATEKVAYGLGDTASNIVFQMVLMFMPLFYTDVFGISAAAMGTLFLVVRVFDAITDPVMGALCDRTSTRWGKFRPYLLALSVPFGLAAVVCFVTPPWGGGAKLAYAYVTYSLLMAAYTAINIPYCALGAVLTSDSRERVSLNAYRFGLASVAVVLVASATLPCVAWLGGGDDRLGFPRTVAALATLATAMFVACFALTRERVAGGRDESRGSSIWRDIGLLLRNDRWRIVAAANFLLLVAIVMRAGSAAYYIKWCADLWWFDNKDAMLTALHTTAALAMIAGAPFATLITKRFSNADSYALVHLTIGAISIAMYFLSPAAAAATFVAYTAIAFFTQMGNPVLWAMLADTVDYGEEKTGRRITGLAFAGALFSLKVGMAVGGAVLGWVLGFYGYDGEAAAQTQAAQEGVRLSFTVLPGVVHLVLAATARQYR